MHAWRKNIRSLGQNVGQLLAKETQSLPDDDSALQKKATNLIDYCGSLADKARPHSVQRLQVQLLVGFGWNEAGRRPLHRLGYSVSISKIILVPLPKRLRIRGRNLLHIVAKRGKLASNIVCRHSCFDTNEAGLQVCKPRCNAPARDLLPQHDGAAQIQADHVKGVLAHINADSSHCVNGGLVRHGGAAPSPDKPPTHSESRWGRERGRSIPFATFRGDAATQSLSEAKWTLSGFRCAPNL